VVTAIITMLHYVSLYVCFAYADNAMHAVGADWLKLLVDASNDVFLSLKVSLVVRLLVCFFVCVRMRGFRINGDPFVSSNGGGIRCGLEDSNQASRSRRRGFNPHSS
jgi:hypothetical protein